MTSAQLVLLLLASMCLFVLGVAQYHRGWAQRAEAAERARIERGEPASRRVLSAVDVRLRRTGFGRAVDGRLTAAGMTIGPAAYLGTVILVSLGALLVGSYFLGQLLGLVAAVIGVVACVRYVNTRRDRRLAEFVAQLPELARTMSNASSAGLALPRAIEMAAFEVGEPAAGVVQRVVDELRLGQSVEVALENLGKRLPSREVNVLVSTLVIQQRAGGDTVRALRDMATTLQKRKDLRREVQTIMSGAIATSYIVGSMGLGFLVLVNFADNRLLQQMAADPVGQISLLFGGTLFLAAWLAIRRLTKVET
jgi:tight adherence protein B